MKKLIALLVFWILCHALHAQDKSGRIPDIQNVMEQLFPFQEEELEYESLYEQLLELYQKPLEINTVTREELIATHLLTPIQAQALLTYRETNGPFISIYELQSLPTWDSLTLQLILPFLTLETPRLTPKSFLEGLKVEGTSNVLMRHRKTWQLREGFRVKDTTATSANSYLGGPHEWAIRYRNHYPKAHSLGFMLEKDAGEAGIWDPKTNRYGFNFASFHWVRYNLKKWKTLTLGDFQASFGQGLVFGAGFSLGKGAETITSVRRSSRGLLPYTASQEQGFFRGLGASRSWRNWHYSLLLSSVSKDGRLANPKDSLDLDAPQISSLPLSSLHRTPSELSVKNQVRESNVGGNIHYQPSTAKWTVGVNGLITQLSLPLHPSPTRYNTFDFSGNKNRVASMYFNYSWKNFMFFGETARSSSSGTGSVIGALGSLSKSVDLSLAWRKYARNFHSFYATAFSESTQPRNEQGVYIGFQLKPSHHLKFNAYFDFFSFPWLKFRVYTPSKGQEWLARWSYQPNKTSRATLQFKQEKKLRNWHEKEENNRTYQVRNILKSQAHVSLAVDVSTKFSFRSQLFWNRVKIEDIQSQGWMLVQSFSYKQPRWKITTSLGLFDTESVDNRIYAYEQNAFGTFAIPAFSGMGSRQYVLVHYQIHPKLTTYFRWAHTYYADRTSISSGTQTIHGPKQTDTVLVLQYVLH
uniref:ComEA family DNA-binding protein n=1 Tax=Algoriphagus sp. TaxID=1872435 RepID=UPI0040474C81